MPDRAKDARDEARASQWARIEEVAALPKSFSVLRAAVESSLVASIHWIAESPYSRKLQA